MRRMYRVARSTAKLRWWRIINRTLYSSENPFPVISLPPSSSCCAGAKEKSLAVCADVLKRRERVLTHGSGKVGGSKLTVRERIAVLADEETDMLEIGLLAGLGMPYGDIPCGGNVVCIMQVSGEMCVVSANDWSVKGGCSFPITLKKQLRAQEIALQNRLPSIYLVDSGGAFLPLQSEIYPDKEHGGRVFRNEAVLSSLGIPQIAVVTGSCTAGGAYVPMMCDEAVMVEGIGSLYLGGPPLVRAATGEVLTSEELGGANVHCSISGCTDHFTVSEAEALLVTRRIVASLNLTQKEEGQRLPSCSPMYAGTDEEFASLTPKTPEEPWPMMQVLAHLVDESKMHLFKERFGKNLIAGFARLDGHLVGMVGSCGVLDHQSAVKGAHFIRLCTMRGIPLVFLVDTLHDNNFLLNHATSNSVVVKSHAQMMTYLATTNVPKLAVILGGSYGPSAIAMCGRAMQPNFLFCWPHGRMALASPKDLIKQMDSPVLQNLLEEESTLPSSALYHDGIILPSETRQVLSQCLAITSKYVTPTKQSTGVLRM